MSLGYNYVLWQDCCWRVVGGVWLGGRSGGSFPLLPPNTQALFKIVSANMTPPFHMCVHVLCIVLHMYYYNVWLSLGSIKK